MVSKISGQRLLIIALTISIVLLGGMFVYQNTNKETSAFINMKEVFDKFQYKTEMESKYNKTLLTKKALLDSFEIKIEFLMTKQTNDAKEEERLKNQLDELKQTYMYKKEKFEEENNTLVTKVNSEIWEQLNQYIKDFGTANNYDYIFGTNGDGNLMYAKEKKDITKQVLEYVNAKYQGNAKK